MPFLNLAKETAQLISVKWSAIRDPKVISACATYNSEMGWWMLVGKNLYLQGAYAV
jgi:hypothetical protein